MFMALFIFLRIIISSVILIFPHRFTSIPLKMKKFSFISKSLLMHFDLKINKNVPVQSRFLKFSPGWKHLVFFCFFVCFDTLTSSQLDYNEM